MAGSNITSTNRISYSYIEEVVAGVTPATPNLQQLPITSASLDGNISTAVSETIREDRQTDDLITVDSEVGGDFNFEVTYDAYKPLLTALMQNDTVFSFAEIESDVSATFNAGTRELTISSTLMDLSLLEVGRFVRISGFAVTSNNGIFRVTEVTDANNAVFRVPTTVTDPAGETAGAAVTIECTTSVRNGADTAKCYTFLKKVAGITNPAHFYYRGVQISGASFDFSVGSILTAVLNTMGLTEEATETAIAGQTITAPAAYKLMNSVSSLSNVDVSRADGSVLGTRYESMSLNYANGTTAAKQLGTLGASDLSSFSIELTGEIRLYFQSIETYNSLSSSEAFSLSLVLQDADGNAMVLSVPHAKIENIDKPVEGRDSFFFQTATFRGLRDPVNGYTFQIDFIDAA